MGLRKRASTCYSVCFFFLPIFLGGITLRDIMDKSKGLRRIVLRSRATQGGSVCVIPAIITGRSRAQGRRERGKKGCAAFVDPDAPLRGLTLFNLL